MYDRYYKRPASSIFGLANGIAPHYGKSSPEIPVGIACCKTRLSRRDASILLVQFTCLIATLLTVFYRPLAIWLGQLNQLIVLGFLLGIMALFLQEQVLQTGLIYMGYRHNSTLQELDSFLRKDLLAPQISVYHRLILLGLVGLPLGISVLYKLFIGGDSTKVVNFPSGIFGFSAIPGNQRIGEGLTLLSEVYRPFWIDPAINRTYGFNLYIASNDTAVIPDTPYPTYLSSIQGSLLPGEHIQLSTIVNATISTLANPTLADRGNNSYWNDTVTQFGHLANLTATSGVNGANNALLAGMGGPSPSNFSIAFFSSYNTTLNESFTSEAIRIESYRALYHVSWTISSTATNLTSCTPVNPHITNLATAMDPHLRNDLAGQTIIQNQILNHFQELFVPFLGEYDWHNRAVNNPYPTLPNQPSRFLAGGPSQINTVPALSAAMIWARTTSLNGGDRPNRAPEIVKHTKYDKAAADIKMLKTIPTLKRSRILGLILCINPAFTVLCLIAKVVMWRSPIGAGFNTIAMLSAAMRGGGGAGGGSGEMGVLKGAGLSGRLERRVGVAFFIERGMGGEGEEGEGEVGIGVEIDGVGRNQKLDWGREYG